MKHLLQGPFPAVVPSLLAADPQHLGEAALEARSAGARFLHFDVMDGRFVPERSFDLATFEKLPKSGFFLDVHLMVEDPEAEGPAYAAAGADLVSFHVEAVPDPRAPLKAIRQSGAYVGLALRPETPLEAALPYLGEVDLLLLMSVVPGRGGQTFLPSSLAKIAQAKAYLLRLPGPRRPLLEVDGGLNHETGPAAVKAGADLLVAGSYLFGHPDFPSRMVDLVR